MKIYKNVNHSLYTEIARKRDLEGVVHARWEAGVAIKSRPVNAHTVTEAWGGGIIRRADRRRIARERAIRRARQGK